MKYVKEYWYDPARAHPLIRGLLPYARNGETTEMKGSAAILFYVFKIFVDKETEAYERKVAQCKETGRKGGKSKSSERKRTLTDANETSEEQEQEQE